MQGQDRFPVRRRSRIWSSAAAVLLLSAAAGCGEESAPAPPPPASAPAPAESTSASAPNAIVAAATAFLDTLSADERDRVLFDRGDKQQQQRWSNLPDGIYDRAGLMIGDLARPQTDAFLALMRATLSPEGYTRVLAEWAADDVLAAAEGRTNLGTRLFRIALIGEPSPTEPWQWQFGGHHVSINATLTGAALSLTPSFLGAQPATYTNDGTPVRPLGDLTDQAFALVNSLDAGTRRRAVLGSTPIDLVLGAGQDCRSIAPEGLPASAMTPAQRAAFLALISEYGSLGNPRHAAPRLAQLRADLPGTHFAWYGPTTPGSAAYFRITGPHVHIEYSPRAMGGDAVNHIHGIYRDPTNDYGGTVC
ncbi:DUF3500 domain-containing protein [Paractinoplanes lichenicola]|uniref:DUF3500 domain-containing protein n=1 Tax=Paractinoplanes lichenicola TaxID=2802976 RepID=A0ABS1VME6_9ACTN|nr:DUF3500 domain-containing protein [Actinoplanes lichenicola]MBL7255908.1 DUF3500 domain-containing protein [Actinoplanes lichenicola]